MVMEYVCLAFFAVLILFYAALAFYCLNSGLRGLWSDYKRLKAEDARKHQSSGDKRDTAG